MAHQTKLAVILHADIVDSTKLVQRDERVAHERIRDAFRRLAAEVVACAGTVEEVRGDAVVAQFDRASDAVTAAVHFQHNNGESESIGHELPAIVRIGIALGEVVIADSTVTGAGVVLAQRLEQLAKPGGLVISSAVREAMPARLRFTYVPLGDQSLKGFDEPVRAFAVSLADDEAAPALDSARPFGPSGTQEQSRPSIAVLPFDNLNRDPEQEYFSDGIADDVITSLSRFSDLVVIARNSSFTYRDKAVDVRVVGRELEVQYVLQGSVRKAGKRVRVTAQLSETHAGTQTWAERFDQDLDDFFEVQDLITASIVSAVGRGVVWREGEAPHGRRHPTLLAWELTAKAEWHINRPTAANFAKARTLCDEVTVRFPDYGRGHAILAYVCIMQSFMSQKGPPQDELWTIASVAADRAITLAPDSEPGRTVRALVLLVTGEHEQAAREAQIALSLNPNHVGAMITLAIIELHSGPQTYEAGVARFDAALRLSPLDSQRAQWFRSRGGAELARRHHQVAIEWLERAMQLSPERGYALLAAAYALNDELDKARSAVASFYERYPGSPLSIAGAASLFKVREEYDYIAKGLDLAIAQESRKD